MSSITRLEAAQLAGLQAVFFAPVAALPQLPDLDADGLSLLGDLVLVGGTTWSQLQGTIYTPSLDVDAQATVHGPGYEHELSGLFAGDALDVASRFAAMQGRRFVLLYRDYAGVVRLVGDPRGGLLFSYKLASGTKPGERKGYKWVFKGSTASPALFYAGVLPANMPAAPVVGTSGVAIYTRRGRYLGTTKPGDTRIIIDSPFKVVVTIQ